jgi:hypothetical protein
MINSRGTKTYSHALPLKGHASKIFKTNYTYDVK